MTHSTHYISHFGDDLPNQSLDWCKNPVFPTNHWGGTSKIKQRPSYDTETHTNNNKCIQAN